MNQNIKLDTVDFNSLVKSETNVILNTNCSSKMIEILNKEFTESENRWYIANLYIYMNYHPTNDFPITLDTLINLVGFANKQNAKRTLVNNFKENIDYKVLLVPKDEQKNGEKTLLIPKDEQKNIEETRGGHNKEKVMLNIDTFKNMCMLVKTEKSKEIRSYYVKLENIYNKIIKEELEEQKKLLEQKTKELDQVEDELEQKEEEKIRLVEQTLRDSFDKRQVVYLIKIILINEILYKFGFTDDIVSRLRSHKNNISDDIELIFCIESKNNVLLEKNLKDFLRKYNFRTSRKFNNINQTELICIDDIEIIKTELVRLNNEIENDKELTLQLKNEIVDLKLENLNLQKELLQRNDVNKLKNKINELQNELLNKPKNDSELENIRIQNELKIKTDELKNKTCKINELLSIKDDYINNQLEKVKLEKELYKRDTTINNLEYKIEELEKELFTYRANNPVEIKNIDTVQDRINKKRKVNKIDPETLTILETYESISSIMENNKDKDYSYNQLYRSIVKNCVYRDYRWNYTDIEIKPTKKIMSKSHPVERIIQLNDKEEFVKVFSTKTEVCKEMKTDIVQLNKYITPKKIFNGFYYIKESEYDKELPNDNLYKIHNSKQIREINLKTNEVIIYNTMKDLYDKRGICRSTLRGNIKNNIVRDDFKWEYVVSNLNKNNCKRIKETNLETNEIVVYNSMREVYSKLDIPRDKFKNLMDIQEPINNCKYEFA